MPNLFQSNLSTYPEVFARSSMLTLRQIDANNLAINMVSPTTSGGEDTYNFTYASDCTACLNALKVNAIKVTSTSGDVYVQPINIYNLLINGSTDINVYSVYGPTIISFADSTAQMAAFNAIYNASALLTSDLGSIATHAETDYVTTTTFTSAIAAIPVQVQADWSAISGASKINNKPTTVAGYGITDGVTSTSLATTLASYVTGASLSTTLGGYATTASLSSYVTNSSLTASYSTTTAMNTAIAAAVTAALPAMVVNNAPTFTIVSSTSAGGTQLSTTKNSTVTYSGSVSTSATIGGAAAGSLVLEICATNSTTASDWKFMGGIGNNQTITLAIALQSVQVVSGMATFTVPPGWFYRVRSLIVSGTPIYTTLGGQITTLPF